MGRDRFLRFRGLQRIPVPKQERADDELHQVAGYRDQGRTERQDDHQQHAQRNRRAPQRPAPTAHRADRQHDGQSFDELHQRRQKGCQRGRRSMGPIHNYTPSMRISCQVGRSLMWLTAHSCPES